MMARTAAGLAAWSLPAAALAAVPDAGLTPNAGPAPAPDPSPAPAWNWHVQNTDIVQGSLGFPAEYSGPNSLDRNGEIRETVSLDLLAGVRWWRGAEAHVDGMMWQGFGLSKTLGVEAFPNGEAFRLGADVPNVTLARVFLRQTLGLGGEAEAVAEDALHLAGPQDVRRLTLTLGKVSAKDLFDNNAYANDPRTQFMNWGLMANEAWDFPADSLGYMTGFAAELNQPGWTARYGFFQVPRSANGMALDDHYLEAWAMVAEFEHRHTLAGHPGAVRVLGFLNQAHMGSFQAALDNPARPADLAATRAYRQKFGFGLNLEQELGAKVGAFARLGWNDGRTEPWCFSDVDRALSAGLSLKGEAWHRPADTLGLAGVLNGLSGVHREFLAAGGQGILAGDGALNFAWERALETYYSFQLGQHVGVTFDYQFVMNPANNQDRGPVSMFAGRLHWEF